MPTATTATAADASSGVIKEVGAGQPSNQERCPSGPADGVHFKALALEAATLAGNFALDLPPELALISSKQMRAK